MLNLFRPSRIPKDDTQGWPAWNSHALPVHDRWTDTGYWAAVAKQISEEKERP